MLSPAMVVYYNLLFILYIVILYYTFLFRNVSTYTEDHFL